MSSKNIHKIIQIHPIILPQRLIVDNYNNPNAYVELNPAIFINSDGKVTILVRHVNYRKFKDKSYIMFEPKSRSYYSILTGQINNNEPLSIENMKDDIINYEYKMPVYNSYWQGLEDIRFVTENIILVIIPECNSNESGDPCIFTANLNNSTVDNFKECKQECRIVNVEKNWMPYYDDTEKQYKVIYSLNPFIIKSIKNSDYKTITFSSDITKELDGYHGSTNGIKFNDSILFLIHINKEKSYHRWILFNNNTNTISLSKTFTFFSHSYIEFSCSLTKFEERIFISLGVDDCKAFIIEISSLNIEEMFI